MGSHKTTKGLNQTSTGTVYSRDYKLTRIGVFYDGNYFLHISNYYNYVHPRRSRISIGGLHEFIRNQVAEAEGVDIRYCQVVEVHYFRGRLPAYEAHNRNKLLSERIFDDILMREGVVTHYLPVTNRGEKGIDVWLALEAFEQTIFKGFNVLVLITCDGDYVPLIRKINGIGTRVMVLAWDFEFTDEYGVNRTTVTSTDLLAEVSYPVHMDQIIDDPDRQNDSVISNIFVQRDSENHYNTGGHGNTGSHYYGMAMQPMNEPLHANHRIDSNNSGNNNYRTNRVHSIKEGYGFVQTEIPGKNLFFFWEDVLGDFNDLRPGDLVEYKLGMNQKGECAKEIRKIRSGNTDPNFNYSPYPMHSDSQ